MSVLCVVNVFIEDEGGTAVVISGLRCMSAADDVIQIVCVLSAQLSESSILYVGTLPGVCSRLLSTSCEHRTGRGDDGAGSMVDGRSKDETLVFFGVSQFASL